jgi:hypothetical protein
MAQIGTLSVWLTANAGPFTRALGQAQRGVAGFARQVTGLGGMVAGALGGFSALAFAKGATAEYAKQEKELAKLAGVLAATGGASGYTVAQLNDLASELQRTTVYADDTALAGMAMLATFKNVKGDQFRQAAVAAADLASVMGTSLDGSMRMVGRALEDPIRGMTMLRRMGVTFTEEQKTEIKALVAAGQLQVAQQRILTEIQAKYGGVAAATADTVSGKLAQTANKWSDVKEMIGFTLVEGLRLPQLMDTILAKLAPIEQWFAAGNGVAWFLEIEYGFKKMQALLGMLGANLAAPFLWVQENWGKLWANALAVVLAFDKDLLAALLSPLTAYFQVWRAGWANAWEFVKSGGKGGLGAFFDQMVLDTTRAFADQIGGIGKNTEEALAAMGATPLAFYSFADMGEALTGLDVELEEKLKNIAKPFAKQLTQELAAQPLAPEAEPEAVSAGASRFAAAVEKGSLDAYKAMLPKRENEQVRIAKEQLAVQRRQLAVMEQGGGMTGLELATIGVA